MSSVKALVAQPKDTGATHAGAEATAASAERCPVCRDKLVVRLAREVVIRNAILRVDALTGRVAAKCARCKSWVEVPLRYVG